MSSEIDRFLAEHRPETPCLVVGLDVIGENYRRLGPASRLAIVLVQSLGLSL